MAPLPVRLTFYEASLGEVRATESGAYSERKMVRRGRAVTCCIRRRRYDWKGQNAKQSAHSGPRSYARVTPAASRSRQHGYAVVVTLASRTVTR
jgi:hypothetical protein